MSLFDNNPPAQSFSRDEKLARLRLIRSENIGPITFRQLVARFRSAEAALKALPDMARRGGKKTIKICSEQDAKAELATAARLGMELICRGEAGYSPLLGHAEDAPPVIYAKGHLHLLQKPAISLVGARNASAAGFRFAEKLAHDLGEAGYVIVSGLARGIDTAAHRGALGTGTIAVVAGGIDVIYPKENEALYAAIAEQGLIISEMPPGAIPQASHFPRRNRIISGLSSGVAVVEATLKSGSLITARYALEQGREVFAVPGSPMDPRSGGPNSLIRQGALLIEKAGDVIEALAASQRPKAYEPQMSLFDEAVAAAPPEADIEAAREMLLEKLSHTPVEVDELVRQSGLAVATVLVALLELEVAGLAGRQPGNRVTLA
jgi:DNA processing protein